MTTTRRPKALHLFAGAGGGALGFQRAGFESVGAFDFDAAACRDLTTLTGEAATVADLATMNPAELRAACTDRPDVVFTSPPCKGHSGCLPQAAADSDTYQAMNSLALRGIWLALEAWSTLPPPLIVMENVPRIQSRGETWLRQVVGLLHAYGYAVAETVHDAGELGGLAQRRRRYLLVARHMKQIPGFLRLPPLRPLRGVGSVIEQLPVPVPGSTAGGPMHRLPRLAPLNWIRLALVPAGGDWRDIPAAVAVPFPIDPRLGCEPRSGVYGVTDWNDPAGTIIANARPDNGAYAITDPRVGTIRREGACGVTGWDSPSTTVIGHGRHHNGPWQVADPRLDHAPRRGAYGVTSWAEPTHCIRGNHTIRQAPAAVADPRVPTIDGPPLDWRSKRPADVVIVAADGTWHRPLTTLELAALQGFPTELHGKPLVLDGRSDAAWRERIGNAVPPPAAEAIGRACLEALNAAGKFSLSNDPIWVAPPPEALAALPA